MEFGIHIDVNALDHLRDGGDAGGDGLQGLIRALLAVAADFLDPVERRHDRFAVAGVKDLDAGAAVEFYKPFEGGHVLVQVAVGRRDDRGRPAHDQIGSEHGALLFEQETEVVAGVAGGVEGDQGRAGGGQALAVLEAASGCERRLLAEGEDGRAVVIGDTGSQGPVVAVQVTDQDRLDLPSANCRGDRIEVPVVLLARVEDEHGSALRTDDIGVRARAGEHPRVVLRNPQHAARQPHRPALHETFHPAAAAQTLKARFQSRALAAEGLGAASS